MSFLKKQWSNILFIALIALLVIPQTRKPIAVFFNRIVAFSPSFNAEEDMPELQNYDWALEDPEGNRVDFSEFENDVIIVNFWATWCPPCIAEMPSFQDLYADYGDRMTFIFASMERHKTTQAFFEKQGLELPRYKILSQAPEPMKGKTLPTTYLIDRNGRILVEKVGAADWNSESFRAKLDKLLD